MADKRTHVRYSNKRGLASTDVGREETGETAPVIESSMTITRTEVGIVGAAPAGLLLAHLLAREGIGSVVLEDKTREHLENRVRAGVLEQGTVDLLTAAGPGERMKREGRVHQGIENRFDGQGHHIDFPTLMGGKAITVHGQQETGAKGMTLAVAHVRTLTEGLTAWYRRGDASLLAGYSARCLKRIWKAQRFSWWMTTMLHLHPGDTPFDRRRQIAELDHVTASRAAMTTLAENCVGLPFEAENG